MPFRSKLVVFIFFFLLAAATTFIFQKTQQADINYYRGRRLYSEGLYAQAVPFLARACSINPNHVKALRLLGDSYQWSGEPDEALSIFERLSRLSPSDPGVQLALAQIYSWKKEYDRAIVLYERLIKEKPSLSLRRSLAEVYLWAGQYDNAERLLKIVLESDPRDRLAQLLMAKVFHYTSRAAEAAVIYESLLNDQD